MPTPHASRSEDLTKKLRLLRKKIRQIDDLIAVKAAGGELNTDQEAKIQTKPELVKTQKDLTSQIEKLQASQPKDAP
eukprot:CAMPEP_0206254134 /NCGR_PEP_ID=MMETSP0047_2-20121206/23530_1 /ASSEMBLY_ACC=CAM_ASM_000192 /TAXON_ID=195065 /ORGANISM="Chroomonas mesostigmatica_cf, Strain CCMP1168" /LENGTH=76 /DNA_ID=CAMNT_0053680403 /DNA_START=85 /DNA_END=311 /DNA_ORIENTATION=-